MKINAKLRLHLTAARQPNNSCTYKMPLKYIRNNGRKSFYRINFHPLGFAFSFRLRSTSYDGTSRPNKIGKPEASIGPPEADY